MTRTRARKGDWMSVRHEMEEVVLQMMMMEMVTAVPTPMMTTAMIPRVTTTNQLISILKYSPMMLIATIAINANAARVSLNS